MPETPADAVPTNPANVLGLDYRALAAELPYRGPIIDCHTHVGTRIAAEVFFEAAELYNVVHTYTMCGFNHAAELHPLFHDKLSFICVPDFRGFMQSKDLSIFTDLWLDDITRFRHELGSEVIKLWCAPRGRDIPDQAPPEVRDRVLNDPEVGHPFLLDSPIRRRGVERAIELGYQRIMLHVADPDTWFATKYADASRYGSKRSQYVPMEQLLDDYPHITFIGAHMGGTPEDLDFLQGLLDRHPNYVVDTSACKWQVRELSKHPRKLAAFIRKNAGRVLFGTDIVAFNSNATPEGVDQSQGFGFDLYASRFWALRTLLETAYTGPSPIVDPDLHLVDPLLPKQSTAQLRGCALDADLLPTLYHGASARVLGLADAL
jgi:hypothetical protein